MSHRSLLVLAVGFVALVVAGTWKVLQPRVEGPASSAAAPDPAPRIAGELRQRDAEIARLEAEVSRLEALLSEQRAVAGVGPELPLEPGAALDPSAASAEPSPLETARAVLRRLLPERYGSLTAEEAAALEKVDLDGAKLRDGDLAALAALPALATLSLRGSDVTDAGLAALWGAPALKALDLRGTQISATGLATLPLARLEALHVTETRVTGDDMRRLPPMPNLRVFKLNGLRLGDDALRQLPYTPALEHLEVDRTQVTAAGLRDALHANPTLKRIELRQTPVDAESLAMLQAEFPTVDFVNELPLHLVHR